MFKANSQEKILDRRLEAGLTDQENQIRVQVHSNQWSRIQERKSQQKEFLLISYSEIKINFL